MFCHRSEWPHVNVIVLNYIAKVCHTSTMGLCRYYNFPEISVFNLSGMSEKERHQNETENRNWKITHCSSQHVIWSIFKQKSSYFFKTKSCQWCEIISPVPNDNQTAFLLTSAFFLELLKKHLYIKSDVCSKTV